MPRHEADHSSPSSDDIRNSWRYTSRCIPYSNHPVKLSTVKFISFNRKLKLLAAELESKIT
jgi:hypothetical protein